MDKDRMKGSATNMGGKVKEGAGKLTGDQKLKSEGKGDQAKGKIQNAVGSIKDTLKGKWRCERVHQWTASLIHLTAPAMQFGRSSVAFWSCSNHAQNDDNAARLREWPGIFAAKLKRHWERGFN
jgi:uncharacterized protein YjbJ (UPF0337 family)